MLKTLKKIIISILLGYFKVLAKIQLLKNRATIIGITGSAGKTSTRNAVAVVLESIENKRVKVSYKANSETGIPLNILGLTPANYSIFDWLRLIILAPIKLITNWEKYDFYVVEMGIDSPFPPKNMEFLLSIIRPDVGIFLNAKPMHSQPFDVLVSETDLEKRKKQITKLIADEKGKLIDSLSKKGVAIVNIDDSNIARIAKKTSAKKITFGEKTGANIKIDSIDYKHYNTYFVFKIDDEKFELHFENLLLPHHFAFSLAAAIAIGRSQNVDLNQIKQALEKNFKLPPGRSTLIEGVNNSFILDSSYNASAQPMIDALELIDKVRQGRKLALLGDMRELGEETQLEHQLIAHKAAEVCDLVVLVGPAMKKYALAILKKNKVETHWLANAHLAAEFLKSKLKKNDLLLVKGSQNTLFLEIAVEKLMKHPERADKLLCRRGKFWEKVRNQ